MRDNRFKNTVVSIVAYIPKEGKSELVYELLKKHVKILQKENLATERPSILLKSKKGFIEIFEWKSNDAIEDAHKNTAVTKLWEQFNQCCEYAPLSNIEECKMKFSNFEPLN